MNESNMTPTSSPTPSEPRDEAALALKSKVVAGAKDVADEAKHVASDVTAKARKSAESKVSGGKARAADSLGNVAEALRHTGEQLGEKDELGITGYVSGAADRVDAVSSYLRDTSLSEVIGDVGDFARREPALFLGGAFVLGLIGGRFMKASKVRSPESPLLLSGGQRRTQSNYRSTSAQTPVPQKSRQGIASAAAGTSTGAARATGLSDDLGGNGTSVLGER